MKTKWLSVLMCLSIGLVAACSSSSDNSDSSGGGSGGKASGGSGGKASGGSGGKASGGSGGSASGGSASGGSASGGSASGGSGTGGSASGGSASGGSGTGGSAVGSGGAPASDNGDTAEWNFEQETTTWKALRGTDTVKVSTTTVLKGKQSLEFPINVTAAELTAAGVGKPVERGVGISNPNIAGTAGVPPWSQKTVTFHVWVPTDFPGGYFTTYVLGMNNPWKDSGFTGLNKGGWTEINLAAPAVSNAGDGFLEMGVYLNGFSAPWTGSIFVDSVEIK